MEKVCRICNTPQPIENFQHHFGMKSGRKNECRECCRVYNRQREKINGKIPYTQSKRSSWFLGVHVAERLLESVFENVTRMPHNHGGYDFVCGKGYKVDVKSSCLLNTVGCRNKHWHFTIRHNTAPDYFAFVALDNRESLNPLHFWIVPSGVVSNRVGIIINNSDKSMSKWVQYERPINKLIEGCNLLKVVA